MFLKKIGAGLSGAFALGCAFLWSTAASALPVDWQTGFQPAASPVMSISVLPSSSASACRAASSLVALW